MTLTPGQRTAARIFARALHERDQAQNSPAPRGGCAGEGVAASLPASAGAATPPIESADGSNPSAA